MFDFFRGSRRARLRAAPLPASWCAILTKNVPLYRRLPPEYQQELHGHIQVLLAEKNFEGCGGLRLNDEIRVTIAAHAGMLLLGREAHYFPGLYSVLVYPGTFHVPVQENEGGGGVTERKQALLGESWQKGAIVLAWDAALAGARDPRDGDNVILHEFAHQLDTEDGQGDGVPYLDGRGAYASWARALGPEYERLRARPKESVLNRYGATNPAEFFAVATEAFFERPSRLRERHPELYAELSRFYCLDLAAEPVRAVSHAGVKGPA